jgi:hypothetical protein
VMQDMTINNVLKILTRNVQIKKYREFVGLFRFYSLETFCPYTFCHIRHVFRVRFVTLYVSSLYLLSLYILSFRCFVVIRFVTESTNQ